MQPKFLAINKPSGPTSHDIVDKLRKVTGIKKIGHAGTLDPFASGLLIVGIGRESTKHLDEFKNLDKTYEATLRLGATSDTYDRTGKITPTPRHSERSEESHTSLQHKTGSFATLQDDIENMLLRFEGPQLQTPPMYSAKKVQGKKLYELARKGKTIERKPSWIMIHSINDVILEGARRPIESREQPSKNQKQDPIATLQDDILKFTCNVSSGTYIRSLASNIGQALGCGAYLEDLKRISIGPYSIDDAISIEKLTPENWKSYTKNLLVTDYQPKADPPWADKLPVTLTFGTFDHIHPGHIDFFKQAKTSHDVKSGSRLPATPERRDKKTKLIVGIGRDKIVEKIKGKAPDQDELTRLKNVRALPEVDHAYLMPKDPSLRHEWIAQVNPDVIALGYDQTTFTENLEKELAKLGISPQIIRLKPHHPEKYKSSLIKEQNSPNT